MNNKIPKEEFERRRVEFVAAAQKLVAKWLLGAVPGLFAFIAVVLAFSTKMGAAISGIMIAVSIVIFSLIMWKYSKDDTILPEKNGLICPACGTSLHGLKAGIVAATSKCPECGDEILR